MAKKRGQGSIEMAILLAAGLVFLSVIIYTQQDVLRTVNTQFKETRASAALNEIANGALMVYQQGVGAKTKIYVNFPSGLYNFSVYKNQTLRVDIENGGAVYRTLDFNLSGDISVAEGSRWVFVETIKNGVNISGESL